MKAFETNDITVSVCMITYNHENYIAEAIDSILMQEVNFTYEIVIGEDCSTDNTRQILKEYVARYPTRIKLFLREINIGAMKNLSETFSSCDGRYIAILEGDDYWTDPLKLQKQVDFLESNDEYVITYTSVEAFDENGEIKDYEGGITRDAESIELQKTLPINTATVCFRNVLKNLPPEFGCTKFGDLFLWSILGHYGKGKYIVNIKPTRYRIHDGGIFSKKTNFEKFNMTSITYFALYTYYLRINNTLLSSFFYKESLIYGFKSNGKNFYLKIFMNYSIVKLFLHIKRVIKLLI